jgi:hypothetical protein
MYDGTSFTSAYDSTTGSTCITKSYQKYWAAYTNSDYKCTRDSELFMTTQSFFQTFMIAFGVVLGAAIAAIALGVSHMKQRERIKNAVAPYQ